jgi:uncharacterized protein (TIGR03437 family)
LNAGGGKVTISSSVGTSYTPGQKQTLTIAITDATPRNGFEMTARLASDRTSQAGTFTAGTGQQVLCAAVSNSDLGSFRPSSGTCPANQPLEFIQHSRPFQTGTITVDWTPPPTTSGAVEIYVSANAANGNGNEMGDHIYTASLTLQPQASGTKPSISAGGIINAFGFGGKAGVAPGTWIEIYGQNLSSTTREWTGSDFSGTTAPTSLDGIGVTIGGKAAFIRYISPGQVNVQVPDGIGTGPVPVVVTSGGTSSDAQNVTASDMLPGLLAPASFKTNSGQYVVAQLPDNTYAGNPAEIAGTSRPVKPGEIIVLYGIGFGPVTPSIAAGSIAGSSNQVTNNLVIRFGQIQATDIRYKGLSPNYVGLYQFNVVVPANVPDGDQTLDVSVGGVSTGQTLLIAVKK